MVQCGIRAAAVGLGCTATRRRKNPPQIGSSTPWRRRAAARREGSMSPAAGDTAAPRADLPTEVGEGALEVETVPVGSVDALSYKNKAVFHKL